MGPSDERTSQPVCRVYLPEGEAHLVALPAQCPVFIAFSQFRSESTVRNWLRARIIIDLDFDRKAA
jgi:hypothetical protein